MARPCLGALSEKLHPYPPRHPLLAVCSRLGLELNHLKNLLFLELYLEHVLLCNFLNSITACGVLLLTDLFPVYKIGKNIGHGDLADSELLRQYSGEELDLLGN